MTNLYLISNLRTGLAPTPRSLIRKIAAVAGLRPSQIREARIVKKSIDARKKPLLYHVLHAEFTTTGSLSPVPRGIRALDRSTLEVAAPEFLACRKKSPHAMDPVIVVGSGPAGLFAALALGAAGVRTVLLERGKPVDERLKDIGLLRNQGKLDLESNICFGEGGAGTYTDGKLYSRIKHPYARWVLRAFVDFGADESILVDSHPHLGTENLVAILRRMRERLTADGVDIRFRTKMERLLLLDGKVRGVRLAGGEEISARRVILAVGHSARDTLAGLHQDGVKMEAKDFAVGLRAEHPQELVNEAQYGRSNESRRLGAATYQLTHQVSDPDLPGRGVYTFCMCPGGFIVPSPTESGHMAINGMSNSNRSAPYANSGVVVQVTPKDLLRHGYGDTPLIGIDFQRRLEADAFSATQKPYSAPAMRITDFLSQRPSGTLAPTSFRPLAEPADLGAILPAWVAEPLREGLRSFNRRLKGYTGESGNLLGVESRTSSPVRILRGENGMSVNTIGLYPAGEGAGYAGGIVSAAVDGLKTAEDVLRDVT